MKKSLLTGEKAISPITKTYDITYLKSIATDKIIQLYYESLQIDVSSYFKNIRHIKIFKCNKTGYKFYYPFDIDGDGKFYAQLQKYDWYYMPWKWEHEQAFKLIKLGMKILEVGCGSGGFLKEVKNRIPEISLIGLELNENAINEGKNDGLKIFPEMIQDHSLNHESLYDIVCSFQVLEHISDVKSFIESQIHCLKPGGTLIISVPNNDGFLGDDENILNMPPHHMGLWNKKSLKNLENIFSIKFVNAHFETLQDYHFQYYENVLKKKLGKFYVGYQVIHKFFPKIKNLILPKNYDSFTIQAIYRKV